MLVLILIVSGLEHTIDSKSAIGVKNTAIQHTDSPTRVRARHRDKRQ